MHPLRPGDPERIGDYSILGLLGEGPRGETFLGRESDDAPIRVIKLLPGVPEPAPDALAPYLAAQRVSSSYVARVLDAGYLADRPYVVREHVEGKSLAETVEADGPLTGDALERVAVGVLTALSAVHLAGLTHRSLTPHNVILAAEGPRVTDVTVGDPVGEPGYQAPEQLTGLQYGPYADVFAWAATMTFAATGKPPFADRDAVLTGEPEVGVGDEALRRVLLSALAKDVSQRPTTYSALMQVLGDPGAGRQQAPDQTAIEGVPVPGVALQGVPIPAVPLPGMQPMVPPQGGPGQPMQGPPMQHPTMQGPPMQGSPVPGVPQQAEPMWGPPEPGGQPQQPPQPQQIRLEAVQPRGSQGPRRKFPMGLVAGVGAVALVSAIGLWGANRYVEYQQVGTTVAAQASADGIPVPNSASAAPVPQGTAPDGGPVPQQPQPTVTVPWGATPDVDEAGVAPLVLPTEWPTTTAGVPELTSVPTTPTAMPTQPVVVPTVTQQPTAAPTAEAEPTPTKRKKKPQPTATVTKTEKPTEQPSEQPTEKPSEKPTEQPSEQPTEKPSEKPTEKPSEKPSEKPTEKPTQAPEPKPTPTKPKPTPTQPKPTPTQPKPTPTQPKATAKQAAPVKNPYTPTQVCGSGFVVQRSSSFSGGATYQLWNNSTGQNCVVTMKTVDVGKATPVRATLEVQNGPSKTDSGNFEYYAGPVKLPAAGKCVRYSGSVGSGSTSAGWANCG
ncbi:serine/threonine protein kinase [Nonomuraea sp. NPDC023979]|uniref:serine/threonine protein kinase n=1 Tax=Nonomuraea sp. NPDC023979 TaxID=3154796 RepID=UPI0033BFD945